MLNVLAKITTILLIVLIISFSPVLVFAEDDSNSNEKQIIRVGYTENYGVVKTPMVKGYEGYGYEYLLKMEDYIDYEFEFVLCDWSQTGDMLRSGELDVICPARYTDEREEEFFFTQNMFANEVIRLTTTDIYSFNEDNYHELNSATIGVRQGGASYFYFKDFCDEHGLTPNILFVDINDYSKELDAGNYDFLLTGSLQMESELNTALSLGTSYSYFLCNSQEIADIIDYAANQITDHELLFREQLYTKYFQQNLEANQYISNEELALIQDTTYTVGVVNMYPIFGYTSDECDNISVDVLKVIADILDIDVTLVEIDNNTSSEVIESLDFYFPLSGYRSLTNVRSSVPYLYDNRVLVTNNSGSDKMGVLDYYNFIDEFLVQYSPLEDIVYYHDLIKIIEEFKTGQVSKIVLTESVFSLVYSLFEDEIKVNELEYPTNATIFFSADFPQEKIEIINKAISHINSKEIEFIVIDNMNKVRDMEVRKTFETYSKFLFLYLIVFIIILIVVRKLKQNEVERATNFDRLTGLYTQQKFIKETRKLLNKKTGMYYTMYSFDINNFKYINELYGFSVGDDILKVIGSFLKENLNNGFPVARLSGDHFILVTKTSSNLKVGKIDPNLTSVLTNRISALVGETCQVTYSIGLYFIDDIKIDVEQMIDYSNLARAYSKNDLSSVVTIHSDLMREKEAIKNDIVYRMNSALKNGEFVMYYQPKFDIETQAIVGAEALVRWFSDGKMMPPNDFIPIFEKNGFIEKLDYYVFESVCKFIKTNLTSYNLPSISVNLSSVTLMKDDVVERINKILEDYELDHKLVEIEITESAFIDQFETAVKRVDDLRADGFTISMDDFGTGVSSLGRLKNMVFDVLKIDREFIIETLENEKSDIILESVIKMANKLNLETVAEGIETMEQLEFLKATGCNIGQGYYFARPLPDTEFLDKLNLDKQN